MMLDRIIAAKKDEVRRAKGGSSPDRLERAALAGPPARDFKAALTGRDCAIIAEVKRRSPSRGVLREGIDPVRVAAVYEQNGAAAVSVLTDGPFFGGGSEDLSAVRRSAGIPVLRKDFIIDPCQIYEARAAAADSLLLIAGILERKQLQEYIRLSKSLGMTPLVEVHGPEDLDKALGAGAEIIGINNRDLKTFRTDLKITLAVAALIPADRVVVSESGISTGEHIRMLMDAGVRAFLIGEALMTAPDIGEKLRELLTC
jgi:indole-3-glycerol phosphate synthase